MKRILLIILASLLIISCEKNATQYAIISGKIINAEKISFKIFNQLNPFDTEGKQIFLDENGFFKDTVYINKGNLFRLVYNKKPIEIFLKKGGETEINFDAKEFNKSITFSGDQSKENSYFLQKKLLASENTKELFSKQEKSFIETLNRIKENQITLLEKTDHISKEFKNQELKNIQYEYLLKLSNYESLHSFLVKKIDFKLSHETMKKLDSLLKNIDFKDEENFKFSESYRTLAQYHFTEKARKFQNDSINIDIAALDTFGKIENSIIRNHLLFHHAYIRMKRTNNMLDFYSLFMKFSTNSKNNEIITELYENLNPLSKGKVSPKFFDYENYNGSNTSLEELIGNYVYIDIWATWCLPCIVEIPTLNDLEKKFKNRQIKFVSISIDDQKNREKWKKMIKSKKMGGIQLLADNMKKSQFMKEYLVDGIPRYILIDPNGNIITPNAPRPSDKKLLKLLRDLEI